MTLKEWLVQNDAPLVNEAERYHKAFRALIDAGYDPDTVVTDFVADCCAFQNYGEVKNAVELGLDHGDAERSDYENRVVTPKQVLAMVRLMSTWSNTYAPQYYVSNGVDRKPSWLVPVGNYGHTHKMYIGVEPDGSCHS